MSSSLACLFSCCIMLGSTSSGFALQNHVDWLPHPWCHPSEDRAKPTFALYYVAVCSPCSCMRWSPKRMGTILSLTRTPLNFSGTFTPLGLPTRQVINIWSQCTTVQCLPAIWGSPTTWICKLLSLSSMTRTESPLCFLFSISNQSKVWKSNWQSARSLMFRIASKC